jgi:preprotein translocase subunit SecE
MDQGGEAVKEILLVLGFVAFIVGLVWGLDKLMIWLFAPNAAM